MAARHIVIATYFTIASAAAHDFWTDGGPVPAWVKLQCCGVADAHHLRYSAVHALSDGYHIDGIETVIPYANALPSKDGSYWGFWNRAYEPNPQILCFFAPVTGSNLPQTVRQI
jgi:hypothetical protein